jgi:ABC-type Fe3+/spermidine/putrescine transport system ATPase subunit
MPTEKPIISCRDVTKIYRMGDQEVRALDGVSLDIAEGEFVAIMGPSGSGKSSLMNLIGALDRPTSGEMWINGKALSEMSRDELADLRNETIGFVFQQFNLLARQDAFANVKLPLRYARKEIGDVDARAKECLEMVGLATRMDHRPMQLSGGQQQRVALARALVLNPAVLLLDEPLGALDAKLRKALQIELKALQEHVGITFLYVTHDQEEALTMSDRIAVMAEGRVVQVGTPRDVYEEPHTEYVADFLGVSNLMSGVAHGRVVGGGCRVSVGDFELVAAHGQVEGVVPVRLVIRPERVGLEPLGAIGDNRVPGMVERLVYLGAVTQVVVRLAQGDALQAMIPNVGGEAPYRQGTPVSVYLPADALRVLEHSDR